MRQAFRWHSIFSKALTASATVRNRPTYDRGQKWNMDEQDAQDWEACDGRSGSQFRQTMNMSFIILFILSIGAKSVE
jgi:hypothetical protein